MLIPNALRKYFRYQFMEFCPHFACTYCEIPHSGPVESMEHVIACLYLEACIGGTFVKIRTRIWSYSCMSILVLAKSFFVVSIFIAYFSNPSRCWEVNCVHLSYSLCTPHFLSECNFSENRHLLYFSTILPHHDNFMSFFDTLYVMGRDCRLNWEV